MFEFDAGKLILIGIVALIVIGPKELPRVMLQVGQALAKMRRMAAEFRSQFMEAMREAEIETIKADAAKLAESATIEPGVDPLARIKAELTSAIDESDRRAAGAARSPSSPAPADEAPPASEAGLPHPPKAGGGEPQTGAAASAVRVAEAEMQALAEALSAEIGESAPRQAKPDGAAAQEKL